MNDDMALTELADLLSVLSNPDRLRILFELRSGPRDVASLVETVGVSQSRTSQHLGLLKAHHLVVAERRPAVLVRVGLEIIQSAIHGSAKER